VDGVVGHGLVAPGPVFVPQEGWGEDEPPGGEVYGPIVEHILALTFGDIYKFKVLDNARA